MTQAIEGKVAKAATPKKLATTRPATPKKTIAEKLPSTPNPPRKKAKVISQSKPAKVAKKAYKASFDSKFAPRQKPIKSVVTYRHVLAFEFWIGLILILTNPKEDTSGSSPHTKTIIQAAAFIFLMMILFGITSMGRNAARLAAAFGGLVVLTLAIFQVKTSGRFSAITSQPEKKKVK